MPVDTTPQKTQPSKRASPASMAAQSLSESGITKDNIAQGPAGHLA